jgi:hypothetical protein
MSNVLLSLPWLRLSVRTIDLSLQHFTNGVFFF